MPPGPPSASPRTCPLGLPQHLLTSPPRISPDLSSQVPPASPSASPHTSPTRFPHGHLAHPRTPASPSVTSHVLPPPSPCTYPRLRLPRRLFTRTLRVSFTVALLVPLCCPQQSLSRPPANASLSLSLSLTFLLPPASPSAPAPPPLLLPPTGSSHWLLWLPPMSSIGSSGARGGAVAAEPWNQLFWRSLAPPPGGPGPDPAVARWEESGEPEEKFCPLLSRQLSPQFSRSHRKARFFLWLPVPGSQSFWKKSSGLIHLDPFSMASRDSCWAVVSAGQRLPPPFPQQAP